MEKMPGKKMKENLREKVAEAAEEAIREAEIKLPADFMRAFERTIARETREIAKSEYENIMENIRQAEELGLPLCQDTGLHIFYVTIPPHVPFTDEIFL